jgi:hypothetical protein
MKYQEYFLKKRDIANILTKKFRVEMWLSLDQVSVIKKALEEYSLLLDKSPYDKEEKPISWDSPENFQNETGLDPK